jgi:FkbM family methyltransferase
MRANFRLISRRIVRQACQMVPAGWLLRLRSDYLAGGRSPLIRRAQHALLEVVRLRGIPQAEPFAVVWTVPGSNLCAEDACIRMIPTDSYVENYLFWLGPDAYEAGGPIWWSCLVRSHESVLELGANVGLYTLIGARASVSVRYRAVEPNPVSCRTLRRNLKLNGLDRVEVLERAVVGDRRLEPVALHIPDRDPYEASCGAFLDGAVDLDLSARRSVRVATARINDFIAGVDLIKLDIEGLELEVLSAIRSWIVDARPTLVVELRDTARALQGFLVRLVEEAGYELYAVANRRVVPIPRSAVRRGSLESAFGTRDVTLLSERRARAVVHAARATGLA